MSAPFEEQLALICELQEIDLNLHNLQKQIDSFPQQISDLEQAYSAAKALLDGATSELSGVEKAKITDETELAESADNLRNREARLYAIKTNKEYQASLKEIAEGKRINREREDRLLQHMEQIEALTQKITQLNQDFADKDSAYRAKQGELEKLKDDLLREMEKDITRRPAVAAKIDKFILRKYDFVRQRYPKAVTSVSGGVCESCSTRIPPQLFNEMLKRIEFKACPSCQRLIFVREVSAPVEGDKDEQSA